MARYAFLMRLRDQSVIDTYEALHADIGEAVREAHRRAGFGNYSIFRHGLDLFAYFESDDPEGAFERIAQEPVMGEWWAKTNPLMESDGTKPVFTPIREVFHME